jgi:tRNA(Ile)-lysidine synthase
MYTQFQSQLNFNLDSEIYLAISGGLDSMVLSHLLHHFEIEHTLLHCNFNLRAEASIKDEQFIIDYAESKHIEYHTISFDTKAESKLRKLNTQECARVLRYEWFATFLEKTDQSILLTAHHLDDSIETFFINTLRGTGLKGLAGIANGKHNIYRPLLKFTKSEITAFAKSENIKFREDESNQSDNYLRNKLRHHIVPELKELSTNLTEKMDTMMTELNDIDLFITNFIDSFKSEHNFNLEKIHTLPEFMWYKLFADYGVSRKNNSELIKLIKSHTGSTYKTATHTLLKDRTEVLVSKNEIRLPITLEVEPNTTSVEVYDGQLVFEQLTNIESIAFSENVAYLDFDKLQFPLTIRNWNQGDKIQPLGMKNGSKLISDVLINKKINQFKKEKQLVITSKDKTVWLVDLMVSEKFAISKKTKIAFKISSIKY